MNTTKGKILSLIVAVAMIAGGAQACQINNRPTDASTPSVTTESSIPATTPNQEETPATTTATETTVKETTAPTETTAETAAETTAETTAVETTAAPTAATTTPPAETTVAPSETPLVKTVYATGNVNVRSGPGTTYGKVRTVSAGTPLNVVALTANNWYRLDDSTYVSPSVVSDIMPTPTPTPTPSPTPDPNATPTPTPGAVVTFTSAEATAIAKSVVLSIRSANGLTTNFAPELDTRCYLSASRYVVDHSIPNGSYESCANIKDMDERWSCLYHSGQQFFAADQLDACIRGLTQELICVHVPDMATSAENTEFGVGVARRDYTNEWGGPEIAYYIYISCATPSELQWQIDNGDYD
jgi:hypothetical protein